jgi:hypothetical protein
LLCDFFFFALGAFFPLVDRADVERLELAADERVRPSLRLRGAMGFLVICQKFQHFQEAEEYALIVPRSRPF